MFADEIAGRSSSLGPDGTGVIGRLTGVGVSVGGGGCVAVPVGIAVEEGVLVNAVVGDWIDSIGVLVIVQAPNSRNTVAIGIRYT